MQSTRPREPYRRTAPETLGRRRGSRRGWLGAIAAIAVLVLLAVAYAIDSAHSDTIAKGVRVGGVDVGGMSTAKARSVLAGRLGPVVNRPLVVTFANRRFVLTAQQAGVHADIAGSVQAALARSRGGWFVGRAADDVLGNSVKANISPQVTYSVPTVDGFVGHVTRSLDRRPQDATVEWNGSGPHIVREKAGITIDRTKLRSDALAALDGSRPRTVAVSAAVTPARVTADQLPARYAAAIVIDRPAFTLKLYKHLKLATTYPIAVGMQGLETPAGLYHVQEKQVNPSWAVPNSPWAGSLAGQVIPPGPQDPIKARWIGFDGSAGIHGTDETGSIGTAGSHGCVRMLIPDVIALYPQVQVGDPVYVA